MTGSISVCSKLCNRLLVRTCGWSQVDGSTAATWKQMSGRCAGEKCRDDRTRQEVTLPRKTRGKKLQNKTVTVTAKSLSFF